MTYPVSSSRRASCVRFGSFVRGPRSVSGGLMGLGGGGIDVHGSQRGEYRVLGGTKLSGVGFICRLASQSWDRFRVALCLGLGMAGLRLEGRRRTPHVGGQESAFWRWGRASRTTRRVGIGLALSSSLIGTAVRREVVLSIRVLTMLHEWVYSVPGATNGGS